jgi:haloalkane dehalogenase
MPTLVPTHPDDPASDANRAAWEVLSAWDRPFLVAFSDSDPITGAMAPILRKLVPGTAGLDHPTIAGAGHFLQEDAGTELGRVVRDFMAG